MEASQWCTAKHLPTVGSWHWGTLGIIRQVVLGLLLLSKRKGYLSTIAHLSLVCSDLLHMGRAVYSNQRKLWGKGLLVLPVLGVEVRLLCPDKMAAVNIVREEILVMDSVCEEKTLLLCPWGEIHHFGAHSGANMLTSQHVRRKVQEEVRKDISLVRQFIFSMRKHCLIFVCWFPLL